MPQLPRILLFALTVLSVSCCTVFAAERPLRVFVLAGQSNMVGKRSKARDLPAELRGAQSDALFFSGGEWVALEPGVTEKRGFGPELSFAARVVERLGGPIGIVKLSEGGTNLAEDWAPNRPGSLYEKLAALVTAAGRGRSIEVVGMVWMQGGADAKRPKFARAYKQNFERFIARARADFGNPDMLVVCGRSASPASKYPNVDRVREAQESIGLPGYAWVDCDAIHMGKDGVHYSTQGQVQSGHLFADAMLGLLKK